MKRNLSRYMGVIFVAVVVVPAVFLGLLAIRSIGREEVYIETQLERTLSAEVDHVSTLIRAEVAGVAQDLGSTVSRSFGQDPGDSLKSWRGRSALVDIPFLLSSRYEILWPSGEARPRAEGVGFIEKQQAFLRDEAKVPVYENIAVAYKDEIVGEQAQTQAALSEFRQSEPVREKVYEKAKTEGQQISYRNVEPAAEVDKAREETRKSADRGASAKIAQAPATRPGQQAETQQELRPTAKKQPKGAAPSADRQAREQAERLRSIFISQPLRFSEITARGQSGLVPLTVDNQLRLLYWQKLPGGNIVGCLIGLQALRERILGVLPDIYSPSRILTVLDEKGEPLMMPTDQPSREWRHPFVAQEVSETLPGWEVAAYLTDPTVISSRARTTTLVMWILVFIMTVSIVGGGLLVVRSASLEVKLAQQKTTFVANVSHELKTPLTSIRMFAEMLRDGRQPDEGKRLQYLDIMKAETERLTRLINNVLDFSRMEQGKKRYTMKPCDLVGLTAGIVGGQRASLENNGFTVSFQAEAQHLPVHADEEAIKQALVNLLSNAEKYSDRLKEIDVSVRSEGRRGVASVSDRGIGIPSGEAEKIFGEFYRVDDTLTSRVKGTGLGLTIARRIARDHGGDIVYEGREGGGSTFKLVLPLLGD